MVGRFSWSPLADTGVTPGDYAAFIRTAEVSQLVVTFTRSIVACPMILLRKFRALRVATLFAPVQFAVVIAALVVQHS